MALAAEIPIGAAGWCGTRWRSISARQGAGRIARRPAAARPAPAGRRLLARHVAPRLTVDGRRIGGVDGESNSLARAEVLQRPSAPSSSAVGSGTFANSASKISATFSIGERAPGSVAGADTGAAGADMARLPQCTNAGTPSTVPCDRKAAILAAARSARPSSRQHAQEKRRFETGWGQSPVPIPLGASD
jgi:hypothetical protein